VAGPSWFLAALLALDRCGQRSGAQGHRQPTWRRVVFIVEDTKRQHGRRYKAMRPFDQKTQGGGGGPHSPPLRWQKATPVFFFFGFFFFCFFFFFPNQKNVEQQPRPRGLRVKRGAGARSDRPDTRGAHWPGTTWSVVDEDGVEKNPASATGPPRKAQRVERPRVGGCAKPQRCREEGPKVTMICTSRPAGGRTPVE